MKKIVAFGASNSTQSINQKLAKWAVSQLDGVEVEVLDLNDYEMPIYSIDREGSDGVPEAARSFKETLTASDGVIISFAEHNGSYSAAFKNVLDWMSRLEKPIWSNKPMLLLATSPGARGGLGVLGTATGSFPHQGGQVVASFSLPSFHQNFNEEDGIANGELKTTFTGELEKFKEVIHG